MPFNTIPGNSIASGAARPPIRLKGVPETPVDISISDVNAESVSKTFTSTDVWEVVDSSPGSGSLGFCAIEQSDNASNRSIDARLIIDGNIVWTQVAGWTSSADNSKAIVVIGYKDTTTDGGAAFDYVRFNQGWSLQVQATSASGSVTMIGYTRSQEF